jgi:flagellar basal-body rod protein FlgG
VGEVYPAKGPVVIRSLSAAQRAMQMEQSRIDVLANNLANVNTAGFKQVLTRVAEARGVSGSDEAGGAPIRIAPDGLEMYHALDARPGMVRATGRDTDIAVVGRGYFSVETSQGKAYTRHGSFLLDQERRLITPDGHPVLGEKGPVTLDGTEFEIGNDGAVSVDGKLVDRIQLFDFGDPTRLTHLGGSLLVPPPDMEATPVPAAEAAVAQGHLEGSNVNPIDTLVAMIAAQRAFEVQSKVMQTEDEMLEKSVNNLPRIGS